MKAQHAIGDPLIVNADDFGISDQVVADTLRCFQAGRISSATIMANLPSFDKACALARDGGLHHSMGVHLNLSYGPPLSKAMLAFCDGNGQMCLPSRPIGATPSMRRAAYAELTAQVERVRAAGIQPTHLDSHEHIVSGFGFGPVAVQVAKDFGIDRIRKSRNLHYKFNLAKAGFKYCFNSYLRVRGMKTVQWFGDVKPFFYHLRGGRYPPRGSVELMCHPGAQKDFATGAPLDETALLMSAEFGRLVERFRLISYRQL